MAVGCHPTAFVLLFSSNDRGNQVSTVVLFHGTFTGGIEMEYQQQGRFFT
jgi:hypothetical protein